MRKFQTVLVALMLSTTLAHAETRGNVALARQACMDEAESTQTVEWPENQARFNYALGPSSGSYNLEAGKISETGIITLAEGFAKAYGHPETFFCRYDFALGKVTKLGIKQGYSFIEGEPVPDFVKIPEAAQAAVAAEAERLRQKFQSE
jgi:hypothetical protein